MKRDAVFSWANFVVRAQVGVAPVGARRWYIVDCKLVFVRLSWCHRLNGSSSLVLTAIFFLWERKNSTFHRIKTFDSN